MGLKDSLKQVQERGLDATRRVLGQAREQWEDAERRIRANMRVHPRPRQATAAEQAAEKSSGPVEIAPQRLKPR